MEEVLRKYSSMVYRIAFSRTKSSFEAEDILQDVFLRYIKSKIKFADGEHLKAWLIKVTINCSKTRLASVWFRRIVELTENIVSAHKDTTICELKEKSQVYFAVLELPTKYRTVIHLFYYEDLSIKQISELLGKNESTIKSQLFRARSILKEKLKGVDFDV
jgi:RNA polymerase sigma-70 factor (ECF subfamily)